MSEHNKISENIFLAYLLVFFLQFFFKIKINRLPKYIKWKRVQKDSENRELVHIYIYIYMGSALICMAEVYAYFYPFCRVGQPTKKW